MGSLTLRPQAHVPQGINMNDQLRSTYTLGNLVVSGGGGEQEIKHLCLKGTKLSEKAAIGWYASLGLPRIMFSGQCQET